MSDTTVRIPWDGWQLIEQVGRGEFGTVYKISSTKYGITEMAAMKVISIPNDPQMIEADYSCGYDTESVKEKYKSYLDLVLNEYQLMMRIKGSANVVRCDDISVSPHDDGIGWDVYIRMEFLTPSLQVLPIASNEESVIKLGIDICRALDVCEKADILHRDIKPTNILVNEQGDFKLGDFGVSRTLENEDTYGTKGIGTYNYMAPEIYNGGKYGKAADIYSLGMVMYWLLNDRTFPFLTRGKAPTAQEITNARQKRFNGEALPRPINGSDLLAGVVLKACSFNPKERYTMAKEMLDDLIRIKYGTAENRANTALKPANQPVRPQKAPPAKPSVNQPKKAKEQELDKTLGINFSAKNSSPDSPVPVVVAQKRTRPQKDSVCVTGFVLSFILPVIGIILCLIGKKRIKNNQRTGKGLTTAGIIISIAVLAIQSVMCVSLFNNSGLVQNDSGIGTVTVKELIGSVNGNTYTSYKGKISYTLGDDAYFAGRRADLQKNFGSADDNTPIKDVKSVIVSQSVIYPDGDLQILYLYNRNKNNSKDDFIKDRYDSKPYLLSENVIESKEITNQKIGTKDYPCITYKYNDGGKTYVYSEIYYIQDNGLVTIVVVKGKNNNVISRILSKVLFF